MRTDRWPDLRATCMSFAAVLMVLLVTACSGDPPSGPVAIKYGRDTCAYCGMIISDPRFAAQIRGGPDHKAYKFDDLGEGLVWLEKQPWKGDAKIEMWVNDMDTGKSWLDARKAFYVPVRMSPMGFNYGALPQSREGALAFDEFRKKVLESRAALMCERRESAKAETQP